MVERRLSTAVKAVATQRRMFVGFVAQAMQYGAALLLLPFMAASLSAAEIGVWYLLITVQGLAAIADFGFGGAFARSIATAFAGADTIRVQGIDDAIDRGPNYPLIAQIIRAAQVWYAVLALCVFLVLISAGLAYVLHVAGGTTIPLLRLTLTWGVMALGTALSMYFSWVNPVLIGANRIEQDLISQIVGKGGAALLGIIVLLSGGGLLALAIAQLIALAAARLVAAGFMRPIIWHFPRATANWAQTRRLLAAIAPNASRFGLASLSGFLITRSSVFAVTTFAGLAAGGSYAISLQLLSAVLQVAQIPTQFTMPKFVALHAHGDRAGIRKDAIRISALFLILFLCGIVAVVIAGPPLFAVIGHDIRLLPPALLLWLGLVMMLEGLHSVNAFVLMTGNKVPFTRAAILSAVAVAAGTTVAGWQGWGIGGIIAVQGLVQLSYNNWRWPFMVWQDTRVRAQASPAVAGPPDTAAAKGDRRCK
jgi:O-antigen/teichoic acid export membrane protein